MAQTFKDFVVECELYPYSRENFELMKECSELSLMEKYLENQMFLAEHAAEINSSDVTLTESYFQESTNDSTITALMEETETKKQNIFKRIWQGFLKILKKIGAFFTRLVAGSDAVSKEATKVLSAIRGVTINKSDVEAINKLIADTNDAIDDAKASVKSHVRVQPFAPELKLKYAENVFDFPLLRTSFENKLAVALSTTTVNLKNSNGAISATDLVAACKKLVSAKKDYHAKDVVSVIEGANADAVKNGLIISANSKELQKVVDQLKDLESKVTVLAGNDVAANQGNAEMIASLNEAYAKINGCIAADIKVYSDYMNHRRQAVSKLTAWVNSRQKTAPEN